MTQSAGPLVDLYRILGAAVKHGEDAWLRGDMDVARDSARIVLSAGSKLHARLGILVDLKAEGLLGGGSDAALDRAQNNRPLPIPGQQKLFLDPPAPKRKRKA